MEISVDDRIKIDLPTTSNQGTDYIKLGIYAGHEHVSYTNDRAWYMLALDKEMGYTVNPKSYMELMRFMKNAVADNIHMAIGLNPTLVGYEVVLKVGYITELPGDFNLEEPSWILNINKAIQDKVPPHLDLANIQRISITLDYSPNE